MATIGGNFDETLFTVENCRVWSQFWGYAPYQPRLARLQRLNKSRVRSNLRAELKKLLPDLCQVLRNQCDLSKFHFLSPKISLPPYANMTMNPRPHESNYENSPKRLDSRPERPNNRGHLIIFTQRAEPYMKVL